MHIFSQSVLFSVVAALNSASALVIERTNGGQNKGFACLIDQTPYCCRNNLGAVGAGAAGGALVSGCQASTGAPGRNPTNGYATCPVDGIQPPLFATCCSSTVPLVAGAGACGLPTNTQLPAPVGGSSTVAGVGRGDFTCDVGLSAVCCDSYTGTSTGGVDSVGLGTGCVNAPGSNSLANCVNTASTASKLGICCLNAVNAQGLREGCQYSGLLPSGKP